MNLSNSQVNVCLECMNASLKTLKRRFIRCSAQATITHVKKFIAKKVLNGMEKYRDVSIHDNIYMYMGKRYYYLIRPYLFPHRLIFCAITSY